LRHERAALAAYSVFQATHDAADMLDTLMRLQAPKRKKSAAADT
jgi:hypothetical protein